MAGRRTNRTVNSDLEVTEEVIESTEQPKNTTSKRKEINLVRHTETIDRLVVQNKTLQKDLDDAEDEIGELEDKLADNSIKISTNILYTFLGVIVFLAWMLNAKIVSMGETLVETKQVMQEYKQEIEKSKFYNELLEKKLDIKK